MYMTEFRYIQLEHLYNVRSERNSSPDYNTFSENYMPCAIIKW